MASSVNIEIRDRIGILTLNRPAQFNALTDEMLTEFRDAIDYFNTEADAKVLVLTGKYDFGAPYHLWEEYNGIIPNFTLKVYEHAGHNPFMEYPEDFTNDILKWVKEEEN